MFVLEQCHACCTQKVAAVGLTSTLTLSTSSRAWLAAGGYFLAPGAVAGAESALWRGQRCSATL